MRAILFTLTVLAGFVAVQAGAQENTGLRSLNTGDDSRGWEAVGRLNIAGHSMCTGALITPDIVLTAAHCLYDRDSRRMINPREIQFLAGLRQGRASAYRWVKDAIAHPDYVFEPSGQAQASHDIALLRLESPIRNSTVTPFTVERGLMRGETVGVVSYARDRAQTPAIEETCRVLARRFGTVVLSCSVDFGASGAPVFRIDDGVARIVSVVSAKAQMNDRNVALSAALDGQIELLLAELSSRPLIPQRRIPGAARISPGQNRDSTGAKFLRP